MANREENSEEIDKTLNVIFSRIPTRRLKTNKKQIANLVKIYRVDHYVHSETSDGGDIPLYPGKAGKSSF